MGSSFGILSAPGDITAEPILSDYQIEALVSNILSLVLRGEKPNEAKLVELGAKFNVALLNKSYSEKDLISNIDGLFDAFVKYSKDKFKDLSIMRNPEEAKVFIFMVSYFLKLLKVKKIYNTVPRQDFTGFHQNKDHTQVLQLTLPRGEDIGDRRLSHGGSCHNWSIIFKEYFDELGIKSSIIFCNPYSNHSFTLIELHGRYYIYDPILRIGDDYIFEITDNKRNNDPKIRTRILVGMNIYGDIDKIIDDGTRLNLELSVERNRYGKIFDEKSCLVPYSEINDFTRDLDEREINYIIFGYRLKNDEGFQIDFDRQSEEDFSFQIVLGSSVDATIIESRIGIRNFLLKFLQDFFQRRFDLQILDQLIINYRLYIEGEENILSELQGQFLTKEEQDTLAEWIGESTNYQLFEKFFTPQKGAAIGSSLYSKKNAEILEQFKKSTALMHKRSVIKFLMFGVFLPFLDDIPHVKDTYARKPKSGITKVTNLTSYEVGDIIEN